MAYGILSPSIVSADRVIAMAHLPMAPHVAVIGHHTLPVVLALMDRGCSSVRSLRPDAAAPDCEAADLAWIIDVADDEELDRALCAARCRAGDRGRIVVEGTICRRCRAFVQHTTDAGLGIISYDHPSRRVVLAVRRRLAMAA